MKVQLIAKKKRPGVSWTDFEVTSCWHCLRVIASTLGRLKHCSDVCSGEFPVAQIDRKSKQVKEQWHGKFYLQSCSTAKNSLFEPPFWALSGNVRTPSMARWKARGRLYIRRNWTFFAISYGWDVIIGNRSKSAFFEGGGSLWAQISEGRGHRPPTTVGVRKLEWLPFRVVSKYSLCVV